MSSFAGEEQKKLEDVQKMQCRDINEVT